MIGHRALGGLGILSAKGSALMQISAPADQTQAQLRDAIASALPDAEIQVAGGGGHFEIRVVSAAFDGKSTLAKQRLVYSAISHLMRGDNAPVHAVDRLVTEVP